MTEIKNSGQIGITAAGLMDKIEECYDDEDNPEIAEVIVVVLVSGKRDDDTDGEFGWSAVQWRASDAAWSHQIGLLEGALEGMRNSRAATFTDGEEDDDDDGD